MALHSQPVEQLSKRLEHFQMISWLIENIEVKDADFLILQIQELKKNFNNFLVLPAELFLENIKSSRGVNGSFGLEKSLACCFWKIGSITTKIELKEKIVHHWENQRRNFISILMQSDLKI